VNLEFLMAASDTPDVPPIPVPPIEPAPKAKAAPAKAAAPKTTAAKTSAAKPAAAPQPYANGPYVAGPSQTLSIVSLCLGIGSIVLCLGVLLGIPAVILGHMASKKEPHARTLWTAGLVTGYIGIALGVIVGIIWLASLILPLIALSTYGY
jgi:hypothetical protein